jgi:hypothetical protein
MESLVLNTSNLTANHAAAGLPLKDYLNSRHKLTYEAVYFPLGYPVRVLSNSPRILEAAEQSWGDFLPMFHGQPFELLFEVKANGGAPEALAPAPTHTVQGQLLVQVADIDNFFIADMKQGRAIGRVTPTTAGCSRYLRYHFLEGAVLSLIATMRAVPVHAACVRVNGKGVLLCGDSGEGKSTLAYAGARAGWTYVTDDSTYVPMDRGDRLAIGNCDQIRFRPSGATLFPELAGRPITPRATGKPSIEVRTSAWPELATANATTIDHVVFLNRRHADTQELVPVRNSAVWPWFTQHLLSPPETRPAQEATLTRLLTAGVFELRYSDLGWAIDRINQLAKKGN